MISLWLWSTRRDTRETKATPRRASPNSPNACSIPARNSVVSTPTLPTRRRIRSTKRSVTNRSVMCRIGSLSKGYVQIVRGKNGRGNNGRETSHAGLAHADSSSERTYQSRAGHKRRAQVVAANDYLEHSLSPNALQRRRLRATSIEIVFET